MIAPSALPRVVRRLARNILRGGAVRLGLVAERLATIKRHRREAQPDDGDHLDKKQLDDVAIEELLRRTSGRHRVAQQRRDEREHRDDEQSDDRHQPSEEDVDVLWGSGHDEADAGDETRRN